PPKPRQTAITIALRCIFGFSLTSPTSMTDFHFFANQDGHQVFRAFERSGIRLSCSSDEILGSGGMCVHGESGFHATEDFTCPLRKGMDTVDQLQPFAFLFRCCPRIIPRRCLVDKYIDSLGKLDQILRKVRVSGQSDGMIAVVDAVSE